ncbi:MAG: hypothetical protein IT374_06900 [Polyangiaceae bacterium]|nr:hypothetical protein [Polyangiaceae bacterium]
MKTDDDARAAKRRPQARLRAVEEGPHPIAEWASLFGDLSRRPPTSPRASAPVEWRIHDKTHLEFAIDYPVQERGEAYVWEAYFFVPESFRLQEDTYDKKAIYDDLWSYVRWAPPEVELSTLSSREAGSTLAEVSRTLSDARGVAEGSPEARAALRTLRLFACEVRAAGVPAMRDIDAALEGGGAEAEVFAVIGPFTAGISEVGRALRATLAEHEGDALPSDVTTAMSWVDEDVSLVLETLAATVGVTVEGFAEHLPALHEVGERLAATAVAEARHRKERGLDSVGHAGASLREVEHLEFRRHVLKRFTSSVLWLKLEVQNGAAWVLHTFYAIAAAVAMAFALAASVHVTPMTEDVLRYGLLVVVAYVVKDRMKALLQSVFAGWISRRFPDRSWTIEDKERGRLVGRVRERAGFLSFRALPPEVLAARRVTRAHDLEESARPERVLWHQKRVRLAPRAPSTEHANFPMMTEIFRLDVHRWLDHTDDPNRTIVFADPDDARVYSATARRVYNVNVVYRLTRGDGGGPWGRLRVVVSRKGIERIDSILT